MHLASEISECCYRFGSARGSEESHSGIWRWYGGGLAIEGSWRFQVRYSMTFGTFNLLVLS